MKILMLAWKDMKNPLKGGAEIVTDIYLKYLREKGHDVTLFSARFKDSSKEEIYNNYKIIRKGGKLTVYYHGLIYAKKNQQNFDIIIDQINTIPFFTPLLIKKQKRIAFFHQLCLNVWFWEMLFPISLIGNISERIYLKFYKNTRAFVVSDSTKKDLIKYCWMNQDKILVLDNQINFKPIKRPQKKDNYFVFCGRLTPNKRPDDCIKALFRISNKETRLYIIGQGNEKYINYLKNLAKKLNLNSNVIFTGKLSNQERNKLMQKAKAILVTSVREGWGLIVTEANANGTLAITYNTEGLKDANKTGFITKKNNPKTLARYMDYLADNNNKELLQKKSMESIAFAKVHSNWDNNSRRLEEWIGR